MSFVPHRDRLRDSQLRRHHRFWFWVWVRCGRKRRSGCCPCHLVDSFGAAVWIKPLSDDAVPEFGLYLLGQPPVHVAWAWRWVRWPDFRLPVDGADARDALGEAWWRAVDERVEIACRGGFGRTGTALACLAVLDGVPASSSRCSLGVSWGALWTVTACRSGLGTLCVTFLARSVKDPRSASRSRICRRSSSEVQSCP